MPSSDRYPDIFRHAVLARVEPILARMLPNGQFDPVEKDAGSTVDCQFIFALTYFYTTRFAGNPYYRNARILEAIHRIGDDFTGRTNADGEQRYSVRGYVGAGTDGRLMRFMLDVYAMMDRQLDAPRRRRWGLALRRCGVRVAQMITAWLQQERFNHMSFWTGPNHASQYAAALYLAGVVFKNAAWRKLGETFFDRYVEYQRPAGYWPEHLGPVVVYSCVSLSGLTRVHQLLPKPAYRAAIERALAYAETTNTPDFVAAIVIDRRQRYYAHPFLWGHYAFTHWPQGRAYLLEAAKSRLRCDIPLTGEESARWMENYVYAQRGPVPAYRPWKGVRFLETHSAFIREKGWQIDLSINPVVVNPGQPFMLDYKNLLGVWHKKIGPVVNGSQDKFRHRHETFTTKREGKLGVLYGGCIGTNAKPRWAEAYFSNGLTGRIETQVAADGTLTLRAIADKNLPAEPVLFNLPFKLHVGDAVSVNGKAIALTRRKLALRIPAGATLRLYDNRVTLRCQRPAVLYFPCLPFEPYWIDNKAPIAKAFLRLETPLTGKTRSAEFRFRV